MFLVACRLIRSLALTGRKVVAGESAPGVPLPVIACARLPVSRQGGD